MATKIKFDNNYNIIEPTLLLARRNGDKLGRIPQTDLRIAVNLNSADEGYFTVFKESCLFEKNNKKTYPLWDDITNFKLVYLREYDTFYQLEVEETEEGNQIYKTCSMTSLGEAELGQIMLYELEFNTEDDIALDDYEPRVLYNKNNRNASLLDLLLEKAPHYSIKHVDVSLQDLQRTFTFDNISLYDALMDIAEELECLFVFNNGTDAQGRPLRSISVYDLKDHCLLCNKRDKFNEDCVNSLTKHILQEGYGEDTKVFISNENIAESITKSTDVDSIKNCFSLEAGDELFTATVRNCNPNGSSYIWNIPNYMKEDMSESLRQKLEEYDTLYDYYTNTHIIALPFDLVNYYNDQIDRYRNKDNNLQKIPLQVVGYSQLMQTYYNTIDFYLYLHDSMMPAIPDNTTSAAVEAGKLHSGSISPIAVTNIDAASKYSVENALKSMAQAIIDSRYKITINGDTYSDCIWRGTFTITSYSNEEDTFTTPITSVEVNSDFETYVKQKLKYLLGEKKEVVAGITDLFPLSNDNFKQELEHYNAVSLQSIDSICQSCLDILIQQGVAEKESDLYELYLDYFNKKALIEEELGRRLNEISMIIGTMDINGNVLEDGIQTILQKEQAEIQNVLNFSEFLGYDLWNEFSSFRRDDKYSNPNYVSDGLTTAELFRMAGEFVDIAKKEITTASTMQHSISAPLKNLLVIKEFQPIVDYFEVGNWLRVKLDGQIYKLRLIHYETDFKEQLDVEFSDVLNTADGITDAASILNQAASMATSYDVVKRQASQGKSATSKYREWVNKGLTLSQVKILSAAENQSMIIDEHGILGREYDPLTGDFYDEQIKIINKSIFFTDDNWKSVRSVVGNFLFWNPETEQIEESYGTIADTLVSSLLLSEKVGIYNESGSVQINDKGFIMTTDKIDNPDNTLTFIIQKRYKDEDENEHIEKVFYVDDNGNVNLSGNILIQTNFNEQSTSLNNLTNPEFIENRIEQFTGDLREEQEQRWTNLNSWIRILPQGLILGETGNPLQLTIQNDRIAYEENGIEVAYFSDQKMFVTDIEVTTNLFLGNFAFIPRANGSLDFKKVK